MARDHKGNIIAFTTKRLLDGTNDIAKCLAAKEALELGVKIGGQQIHLEGDSEIIINGIKKGKMEVWHLDQSIKQIKELLLHFEDFKVSHCYKEENKVVDWLANLGANSTLGPQYVICEDFRHLRK